MADRREQDVAAGLVGLGLDGEAQVVALLGDVVAEEVEGLLHPVQRDAGVLRGAVLRTLATAPRDVHLGAELGGQVDVAHHLAQREAADVAVVVGEAAGLEDRVAEEVGRRGGDHEAGVGEALLEAGDDLVAGGVVAAEGDHVVVVEVDAVRAQLGELLQRVDGVHRRAGGGPERVHALPADGPEAEGELVLGGRGGDLGAHEVPSVRDGVESSFRCGRAGRRRPRGRGGWGRPRGRSSPGPARSAARPSRPAPRRPAGPRRGRRTHRVAAARRGSRARPGPARAGRRSSSRRRPSAPAAAARRWRRRAGRRRRRASRAGPRTPPARGRRASWRA